VNKIKSIKNLASGNHGQERCKWTKSGPGKEQECGTITSR